MAVQNKKVNLENIEVNASINGNTSSNTSNSNTNNTTGGSMIDLFGGFMRPQGVSGLVREFKEMVLDAVKDQNNFNIKLLAFDNQSNAQGWAYSFIVIAGTRPDSDKVYYMPFLLEATGREPVAINGMLEEDPRTGLVRVKDQTMLFTPADYFNNIILDVIEKSVSVSFPGKTPRYIDGEIIPHSATLATIAGYAAADAIGGMWITYAKEKGQYRDLEAQQLLGQQITPYADLTINGGSASNKLGRVITMDYSIKLFTRKQEQQKVQLPGIADQVNNVGNVSGYVEETILSETDTYGKKIYRAIPVLITSEIDTKFPTLGYTLLSMAGSAVLNQQNTLLNLLVNKNNVGALNFLCNLEIAEGFGAIVNIKDKKYTHEKALRYLSQLFTPRAAFAVEVELNSSEYFKVSPFAALIDPQTYAKANNLIVQTAEQLINSKINNNLVFKYAIEIPVGEWVDNNGIVRDLREIDLATIISLTKDINLIHKWIMSNEDPKISQVDPYLTKIEVYNKLGLNAKILNKAVRVYLDPNFMSELIGGLGAVGFNPVLNSNVAYNTFTDLSNMSTSSIAASMLNANLGSMPGFGGGYQYQNYGYASSGFFR